MIVKFDDLLNKFNKYIELHDELDIFFKRLHSVEFTLTNRCSRACTYCYNTQHGMINKNNDIITKEIVDITFDNIIKWNNFIKENNLDYSGIKQIELFGGESLLLSYFNHDLLKYIFELSKQNNLDITIPTNGTYGTNLDDKIINLLEEYKKNVFLSFSIDGTEIIQNFQRPINKQFFNDFNLELPTHDTMINFVKKCHDKGINIAFHPMFTPFTIKNPRYLLDFIEEIINYTGINNFAALAVRNCGLFSDKNITYKDADIFVDEYVKFYEKYRVKNWMTNLPDMLLSGVSIFNKRNYSCSIFNCLYVNLDGKINLCHRYKLLKDGENFDIGHINNDDNSLYLNLNRIITWHRYDATEVENCFNCFLNGMCGKSCLAEIQEKYGMAQYYDKTVCNANVISMYIGYKIRNILRRKGIIYGRKSS